MTAPVQQCQPATTDPIDGLVYRLRYPAWSWSEAFGSNLDKEETLADLNAAADRIEELEKVVREARRFMDPGGDPTRLTRASLANSPEQAPQGLQNQSGINRSLSEGTPREGVSTSLEQEKTP